MKIWKLGIDTGKRDDSQQYQLVNRDKLFLLDFMRKIGMAEKQNRMLDNLPVHIIRGRKEYDISYLWNGVDLYLVNEKAKNSLACILEESVEFIPVKNEKKLYLLNILCVADALDLNNIKAKFYEGKITYIKKFSFVKEKLPRVPIFKVMCEGRIYTGAVFVTEDFKENVDKNELIGFRFEEVGDF